MTAILYTSPNGEEARVDDPHQWMREILVVREYEDGQTLLQDVPTEKLNEIIDQRYRPTDDKVSSGRAKYQAAELTVLENEQMWRRINHNIFVDTMTQKEVDFINKHISATAEFTDIDTNADEGFRKWSVHTSTGQATFPWSTKTGEECPYEVKYATAMMTMLMNQHDVERTVAHKIAIAFVDYFGGNSLLNTAIKERNNISEETSTYISEV